MYSPIQLAFKYCRYFIRSANGKGHGVHSPFVFEFIIKILKEDIKRSAFILIESIREHLLADDSILQVKDFGAGSAVIKSNNRVVKNIAASSLKSKKIARLLYRMVQHYKPSNIIELGTSFGITTSYLALASQHTPVYTLEGDSSIASVALKNFSALNIRNVNLLRGSFDEMLPALLDETKSVGMVFIDGNHRKAATLRYFELLLQYSNESAILVFDDIHWSREMEEAWEVIKENHQVTLSIDLFYIGIIFFKKEFKVKQHFSIRF
ncbi:MAG TPA: class I SAM-dependent methyltransferase [Ferruginibacter sp.]|nr:class I SAM-dependent methyltransferase [Ferruginibacter sp.]